MKHQNKWNYAQEEIPEQVELCVDITGDDLKSTQEEADSIIPHHVSEATVDRKTPVKVICKDTDVSVLLCHCYDLMNLQIDLFMAKFSKEAQ